MSRRKITAWTYQNIRVETRGPVALITLNRPKAFNALSNDLMDESDSCAGRG
jgi:enoyl-CoA hydratase